MKYHESLFDDYLKSNLKNDLHPNINSDDLPINFNNLPNIIIYGPKGIGKYTQMLKLIKKYSPSELKYEKKIYINSNKNNYTLKISDIHYEIDISLLGCNSKIIWHEIYNQIEDIISSKSIKKGIIVCKNFHLINFELLDVFYSYMQSLFNSFLQIKFIIITEQISFINDNIINLCKIIKIPRPTKTLYSKCLKIKINSNTDINNIDNIKKLKNIKIANEKNIYNYNYKLSNKIINFIINYNDINFSNLRENIYDIFIYNFNLNEVIYSIIKFLIENNYINNNNFHYISFHLFSFYTYYNNNYRPIYHVERLILNIIKEIYKI